MHDTLDLLISEKEMAFFGQLLSQTHITPLSTYIRLHRDLSGDYGESKLISDFNSFEVDDWFFKFSFIPPLANSHFVCGNGDETASVWKHESFLDVRLFSHYFCQSFSAEGMSQELMELRVIMDALTVTSKSTAPLSTPPAVKNPKHIEQHDQWVSAKIQAWQRVLQDSLAYNLRCIGYDVEEMHLHEKSSSQIFPNQRGIRDYRAFIKGYALSYISVIGADCPQLLHVSGSFSHTGFTLVDQSNQEYHSTAVSASSTGNPNSTNLFPLVIIDTFTLQETTIGQIPVASISSLLYYTKFMFITNSEEDFASASFYEVPVDDPTYPHYTRELRATYNLMKSSFVWGVEFISQIDFSEQTITHAEVVRSFLYDARICGASSALFTQCVQSIIGNSYVLRSFLYYSVVEFSEIETSQLYYCCVGHKAIILNVSAAFVPFPPGLDLSETASRDIFSKRAGYRDEYFAPIERKNNVATGRLLSTAELFKTRVGIHRFSDAEGNECVLVLRKEFTWVITKDYVSVCYVKLINIRDGRSSFASTKAYYDPSYSFFYRRDFRMTEPVRTYSPMRLVNRWFSSLTTKWAVIEEDLGIIKQFFTKTGNKNTYMGSVYVDLFDEEFCGDPRNVNEPRWRSSSENYVKPFQLIYGTYASSLYGRFFKHMPNFTFRSYFHLEQMILSKGMYPRNYRVCFNGIPR